MTSPRTPVPKVVSGGQAGVREGLPGPFRGSELVSLRDLAETDLPIFYAQQADPEAVRVAVYPSRDRDAFFTHWRTVIVGKPEVTMKAILCGGDVAGHVGSWTGAGKRLVGYWLGRVFWGRGIATAAVADFVRRHEPVRPLFAYVAVSNVASIRVLEKSGFEQEGEPTTGADGVEEVLMRCDAPPHHAATSRAEPKPSE